MQLNKSSVKVDGPAQITIEKKAEAPQEEKTSKCCCFW